MRRIATLPVVLGLAVGVLGMFAFAALTGRVGAQGSVAEQTEVTLVAGGVGIAVGPVWEETYHSITIDTTKYPAGTIFTLNVSGRQTPGASFCMRLTEVVDPVEPYVFSPLPESELCTTGTAFTEYFALDSQPLPLPTGEHMYMFQYKRNEGESGELSFGTVRVLAEWQDYCPPVGGIALLPDIGDTSASNYIVLAALAGLVVVALTAVTRYIRRSNR